MASSTSTQSAPWSINDNVVLRLPPDLAKRVREKKNKEIGKPIFDIIPSAEKSYKTFSWPATSYQTPFIYKTGDIAQMLLVYESEEQIPHPTPDNSNPIYPHGLTPPTQNIKEKLSYPQFRPSQIRRVSELLNDIVKNEKKSKSQSQEEKASMTISTIPPSTSISDSDI